MTDTGEAVGMTFDTRKPAVFKSPKERPRFGVRCCAELLRRQRFSSQQIGDAQFRRDSDRLRRQKTETNSAILIRSITSAVSLPLAARCYFSFIARESAEAAHPVAIVEIHWSWPCGKPLSK